jgi:hypothetical protein
MSMILRYGFGLLIVVFAGCEDRLLQPDIFPPSAPRGLYSASGDHFVELFWDENPEADVAGYRVYVNTSPSGTYEFIGTTHHGYFLDDGIDNGRTYYYAVAAFDFDGNESELSRNITSETARPEGYDVSLTNYRTNPNAAGYDFSTVSVGPYDDQYTDVFFEYYNGIYYLDVWDDSNIQDMGYTSDLYEITQSPTVGWSPTKDVRLIIGHTYVVQTWNNHYAKLRVASLSSSGVNFDWAYQLQEGNPFLKGGDRKALSYGTGVLSRK